MDVKIIASLIALLTAILTSLIASYAAYRKLRSEASIKHNHELTSKQMEACERLWGALGPVSFSPGKERVLVEYPDRVTVKVQIARDFIETAITVFYSPSGLYFSREVRKKLFALRDFILDELLKDAEGEMSEVNISKNKARRFRNKVTELRIAIREEIGVTDLQVAKNGVEAGET